MTVMCHGNDKGHLLDKDKKRAWILEDFIKELSLVETLIGKPKILVLQACRGGNKISTFFEILATNYFHKKKNIDNSFSTLTKN